MADEAARSEQEKLITNFREVAGVDEERARFYLEASAWQLHLAIAGFFEGSEMDVDEAGNSRREDSDPEVDRTTTSVGATATAIPPQSYVPKKPVKPVPRSGMMTMDALRQQQEAEDGDSSDEDANKQAFYAGGSSTSGQQVLGPAKKRDEIIAEMFKKAREHGAEEIEAEPPQFMKKKGSATYGGTGYKLGETATEPSTLLPGSDGNPSGSTTSGAAGSQVGGSREVKLRLWSQGFTVDGGELRSYQDPANLTFLSSVKRGEVPRELIREFQGQEVSLTMEDRRTEDYAPPKSVVKPFAGKGQMLGSPAPTTVGAGGTVLGGAPVSVSEGDRKAAELTARESIVLREGEGRTNIQMRLADGSRLVAQFNPSHTVNDLHSFINTARPEYSSLNYVLMLFPSTELTEKTASLKDANVLNAALVQKIKH